MEMNKRRVWRLDCRDKLLSELQIDDLRQHCMSLNKGFASDEPYRFDLVVKGDRRASCSERDRSNGVRPCCNVLAYPQLNSRGQITALNCYNVGLQSEVATRVQKRAQSRPHVQIRRASTFHAEAARCRLYCGQS